MADLNGRFAMFANNLGQIFKSEPKVVNVRAGAIYRHIGPGNLVETARVLHVGPDSMGITHVRYNVIVQKSCQRYANFEDRRTLNLDTFRTRFSEPVEA
jgi:hypothetical protein